MKEKEAKLEKNAADVPAEERVGNEHVDYPTSEPVAQLAPGLRPPITSFTRPPRHRKRLALLLLLAVVVIAGAGGSGYYLAAHKSAKNDQPTVAVTRPKLKKPAAPPVQVDPELARFITPTTGETWLETPKQVGDLHYVDPDSDSQTTYYQVGMHGQNTIYLSATQVIATVFILYEKTPNGTVYAIEHPSSTYQYDSSYDAGFASGLAKGIQVDTVTHYDSLSLPSGFDVATGERVTPGSDVGYLGTGLTSAAVSSTGETRTVVKTYGASKLVRIERQYADTGLTTINYAIDFPTGSEVDMVYAPIGTDLSTYSWSNGVNVPPSTNTGDTSSTISGIVRGCGSTEQSVAWAYQAKDSDFAAAGKTASGQTVYAFADNTNPLVQKAYSEYKSFYDGDSSVTIVSLNEFLSQHALVAYKNASGQWLIYTRDQYAAVGGCAKPVLYLYPTHAEHVTVRLGAQVTESAPLYSPTTGWQVDAQPGGTLQVGGQTYGSLFWEGQGVGLYPAITSGTVVRQADVLSTIRTQLKQQGLLPNEIDDFVAYWQHKIPSDPYVRLTWFNTSQMNQLAPLTISPKPDTVLRVFLDMEGFSIPPKLPVQHLTSEARKGFTVVEWGGLSQSALQ